MYTKGRIKQVTWAVPTLFSVSNLLREYTRPISSWREYLVNGLCCMITCYTIWLDFTCNGLPDS